MAPYPLELDGQLVDFNSGHDRHVHCGEASTDHVPHSLKKHSSRTDVAKGSIATEVYLPAT